MSHDSDTLPFFYESNECTTDVNCSSADENSLCDEARARCICLHGLFRDITVPEVRCVRGKLLDQWCSSTKQCYVVDPHSRCYGNFLRSLCKCAYGFFFNPRNQSCVRYPEGDVYIVDEEDKILFFNANLLAITVFVLLAVVILTIQRDLICDIFRGKISPLHDAMMAENAPEGDRLASSSPSPTTGPDDEEDLDAAPDGGGGGIDATEAAPPSTADTDVVSGARSRTGSKSVTNAPNEITVVP